MYLVCCDYIGRLDMFMTRTLHVLRSPIRRLGHAALPIPVVLSSPRIQRPQGYVERYASEANFHTKHLTNFLVQICQSPVVTSLNATCMRGRLPKARHPLLRPLLDAYMDDAVSCTASALPPHVCDGRPSTLSRIHRHRRDWTTQHSGSPLQRDLRRRSPEGIVG